MIYQLYPCIKTHGIATDFCTDQTLTLVIRQVYKYNSFYKHKIPFIMINKQYVKYFFIVDKIPEYFL
jgi:hypothetical protein